MQKYRAFAIFIVGSFLTALGAALLPVPFGAPAGFLMLLIGGSCVGYGVTEGRGSTLTFILTTVAIVALIFTAWLSAWLFHPIALNISRRQQGEPWASAPSPFSIFKLFEAIFWARFELLAAWVLVASLIALAAKSRPNPPRTFMLVAIWLISFCIFPAIFMFLHKLPLTA